MEGFQFEEDLNKNKFVNSQFDNQKNTMINLLIKTGLVKTKQQANIVMISLVALLIILSIYLFNLSIDRTPKVIPYNELTPQQQQDIPQAEKNFINSVMHTQ